MAVLEKHYTISHDSEGKRYIRIDLDWDYERRKVHLSMLLYSKESLILFNHAVPLCPKTNCILTSSQSTFIRYNTLKKMTRLPPLTAAKIN